MGKIAERHVKPASLIKLAALETSAKKFSLHSTADNLETIRTGLTHLKSLPESERPDGLKELAADIEDARMELEKEHGAIGGEIVNPRARRGILLGAGLLAAQVFNFATMIVPNEFFRTMSSLSDGAVKNIHMIAAPVILALIVLPARDLLYANGFDKLKKEIQKTLENVGDEIQKQLGSGAASMSEDKKM